MKQQYGNNLMRNVPPWFTFEPIALPTGLKEMQSKKMRNGSTQADSFRPKRALWPVYLLGTLLVLLTLNYDFLGRYDFLSSSNSSQANEQWAKSSSLFQVDENPPLSKIADEIAFSTIIEEPLTASRNAFPEKILPSPDIKMGASELESTEFRFEQAMNKTKPKGARRLSVGHADGIEYDYERVVRMHYAQMELNGKTPKEFPRKNQWMAGGSAGPQSANAFVKPPNERTINSFLAENVSHANTFLVDATVDNALAVNVNFGKALAQRVEVYSGIGYNRFNGTQTSLYQGTEEIIEITYEPIEGGYRKVVNKRELPLSDTVRAHYTAHLIEVPLSLRYIIGNNRLSYFVSGGMSASLASGYAASYTSTAAEGGYSYSSGIGVQAFSFNVGLGLQYGLNENLMLRLEPTFRHAIPAADNAIFNENLNSVGVLTGIFFFFD